MNFFKSTDTRNIVIISLAAFFFRLCLLPFSQTVHADAVSRVFIALDWLENPHYITDGYWGPLHHYLNALFLFIFPGNVTGPKMLNIIIASLTVIPLYRFTMNLFDNRRGAVFASLLYVFSPVVMWISFQALSEVSYSFFVALAMYFMSEGLKRDGKFTYAAFSGFSMTCAAATRYEAWVIIAVFTFVLLLSGKWKFTFVFWLFAMFFPLAWMIGNHLKFGDFLYSVNQNDVWNMKMEGINDNITTIERIKRVLFFPLSFFLNVSPIASIMLIGALIAALAKKKLTKQQLIWLIPFFAMAAVFHKKGWDGSLMLQHRFIITWIVLLLPFVSLVFISEKKMKIKTTLLIMAVVSGIPLSFFWNKINYAKILGENNFGKAVDELALGTFREFEAIPLIKDPFTENMLTFVNTHLEPGDGLLIDFFGWDKTYYIALRASNRSLIVSGAKHGDVETGLLENYLNNHSTGFIIFSRLGKLHETALFYDSLLEFKNVKTPLVINEVFAVRGKKIFSYRTVLPEYAEKIKQQNGQLTTIFSTERDIEFFEETIISDASWYAGIQRTAFWKREPLDSVLRKNAEYMIFTERKE